MKRRGLALFLWSFGTTIPARAQVDNRTSIDQSAMRVTPQRPDVVDDGVQLQACAYPDAQCMVFNQAACNSSTPIQVLFSPTQATNPVPQSQLILAWFQNTGGNCSTFSVNNSTASTTTKIWDFGQASSQGGNFVNAYASRGLTTTTFANGAAPVIVPTSFGVDTVSVGQMLSTFGVCDPNSYIDLTHFKLCLGVDYDNDKQINATSAGTTGDTNSGTDIVGSIDFPVDTKPPPGPTGISTTSRVRAIDVSVEVPVGEVDIYGASILYSRDPGDLAASDAGQPCSAWTQAQREDVGNIGTAGGITTLTFGGENFVRYGICAVTVDWVGNLSAPSNTVFDEPHPECDLFECWPPDVPVQVGYCGAGAPLELGVVAAAGMWFWRQRRRRRRA